MNQVPKTAGLRAQIFSSEEVHSDLQAQNPIWLTGALPHETPDSSVWVDGHLILFSEFSENLF